MPDRKGDLEGAAMHLLSAIQSLNRLNPELDARALIAASEAMLHHGRERGLFDPDGGALDEPGVKKAAAARLREALDSAQDGAQKMGGEGPAESWREAELFHPCIHVSPGFSYYAFLRRHEQDGRTSSRLACVDSRGEVFAARQLDGRLGVDVSRVERAISKAGAAAGRFPRELQSDGGKEACLSMLRQGMGDGLPFRSAVHGRRLRVWCLLTYLFPLVDRTPLLRVRVPDIGSARNVERLLSRCCFSGLAVHRSDRASAVRHHRRARAGTVIFGPEVRTGKLPGGAAACLEDRPRSELREPPVGFVEVYGAQRARVPEAWVVDVELTGAVPGVSPGEGWPAAGCAVALAEGGRLIAAAKKHEGGVVEWLHELLFGAPSTELSPAGSGFDEAEVLRRTRLGRRVEQVWAECLAEDGEGAARRACNVGCLLGRLLEAHPALREELGAEGHAAVMKLRRRLMEGVVTFGVANLRGCLSREASGRWLRSRHRGVEVPSHRLPAGTALEG